MTDKFQKRLQRGPLDFAIETVSDLGGKDMVAVPLTPTGQMLDAGVQAGSIDHATAREVYIAMVLSACEEYALSDA